MKAKKTRYALPFWLALLAFYLIGFIFSVITRDLIGVCLIPLPIVLCVYFINTLFEKQAPVNVEEAKR